MAAGDRDFFGMAARGRTTRTARVTETRRMTARWRHVACWLNGSHTPAPEAVLMDRERSLDRLDNERALTHQLDRLAPSRRPSWPKDDRRSSSRLDEDAEGQLTASERSSRWPIG
jgi:hypothetical protein